jgi:ketosteroid isomerase-like protein
MPSLSELVAEYKMLLENGENLKVIEQFYADDIIQIENNSDPVKGKTEITAFEKSNIEGVNWFEQKIDTLIVDEIQKLVMGEMTILFDSKKMGKKKLQEAFIQKWDSGKITYQRFYYKEFLDEK